MQSSDLKRYLKQQRVKALQRDNLLCTICNFVYNRKKSGDHVHHVFGRGTTENLSYINLLTVCSDCHPPRVISGYRQRWQISVLRAANTNPLNKRFVHTKNFDKLEDQDKEILKWLQQAPGKALSEKYVEVLEAIDAEQTSNKSIAIKEKTTA